MATILNFCGFETGSIALECAFSSNANISVGPVNTGNYALLLERSNTIGYATIQGMGANGLFAYYNQSTINYGFYFLYTSISTESALAAALDSTGAGKFFIHLNTNGNLVYYNQAATLIGIGSNQLGASNWYYIQMLVATNGTGGTGAWQVLVNGQTDLSGTTNVGSVFNGAIQLGGNGSTYISTFYYDDLVIATGGFAPTGGVYYLGVNRDGPDTQWTVGAGSGALYQQVDERVSDGDVTYDHSFSSGQTLTSGFNTIESLAVNAVITAVKPMVVGEDATNNGTQTFYLVRSGSAAVQGNAVAIGSGYKSMATVLQTDPATGLAWTNNGVDNIFAGMSHV